MTLVLGSGCSAVVTHARPSILVSTDFEKGEQLLNAFGGVAGILRYSTGV